ncbi:MAG: glutamate racemase [Alphaproteobacteria bacterium]|nr:glutamate racemase [Alphaproteobacteria bacterium]MCB9975877.1 glutamate racemase [Rhodospirillales bacterium]
MKIGVFDSGLGGLLIAKAIRTRFPDLDMLYFGDTLHLPYGNRSPEAIYEYAHRAIDYMFAHECRLIIVACNTVSATALRKLQQQYLPVSPWPDRRILGVVVPTLETAIERGHKKIGLLGTNHTVRSDIYRQELQKLDPEISITQNAAPLLVPMIENDGLEWISPILEYYLQPLASADCECIILGCTHYALLQDAIQNFIGRDKTIISQDRIIPEKLADYLMRHPEIMKDISHSGQARYIVSDLTESYMKAASDLYGGSITIERKE